MLLNFISLFAILAVLIVSSKNFKEPKIKVLIKKINDGIIPERKTSGAACFDAYSRLDKDININPGDRYCIPLGFAVKLPKGYELQVRSRSGLMATAIDVGLGTIDEDYTGEVHAIVVNSQHTPITIKDRERICQLAIREAPEVSFLEVQELPKTIRGNNGFGSTGV